MLLFYEIVKFFKIVKLFTVYFLNWHVYFQVFPYDLYLQFIPKCFPHKCLADTFPPFFAFKYRNVYIVEFSIHNL